MTGPGDRIAAVLEGLAQLPPYTGLALRGCPPGAQFVEPGHGRSIGGLIAASRNLATATENGAVDSVYVILSRSGRDISALSARPEHQEVVFMPGTALLLDETRTIEGRTVHVVLEVDAREVRIEPGLSDEISAIVGRALRSFDDDPGEPVHVVHGKFCGDIA